MTLVEHTHKVNEIKRSPDDKPIANIAGSISQLNLVWKKVHPSVEKLAELWPGPLTLIVEGHALRIPDYQPLQELLLETGPMACTSANFSSEPAVAHMNEIDQKLLERVDVVIDEQHPSPHQVASTILMFSDNKWKLIRQGVLKEQDWRDRIEAFDLPIEF